METRETTARGWGAALVGIVLAVVGGSLLGQRGGSDSEFFASVGSAFLAFGALGIIVGGVAIGIRLTRD